MIAEAAVGDHGDLDPVRQRRGEAHQNLIFMGVAPPLQRLGIDRQPIERRRPSMAGEQRQHQRGLAVGVEIGPVQGDGDFGPAADDEGHPLGQQGVDIDPLVGQQAVHLLDGVLRVQPACQRQALADQRDRQRGRLDRSQRSSGQGEDALGMQAVAQQALQDTVDAVERNLLAG